MPYEHSLCFRQQRNKRFENVNHEEVDINLFISHLQEIFSQIVMCLNIFCVSQHTISLIFAKVWSSISIICKFRLPNLIFLLYIFLNYADKITHTYIAKTLIFLFREPENNNCKNSIWKLDISQTVISVSYID